MRLLEKRTEVENEIMKIYHTDLHLCVVWAKRTEIENEIMKMYTNKKYSTSAPLRPKKISSNSFFCYFELFFQNSFVCSEVCHLYAQCP